MSDLSEPRLRTLAETALKLARSAPSGQLALARLAETIDPRWLPGAERHGLDDELRRARELAAEPVPFKAIERALKAAWGTAPTRELDELEPEPAAVTQIAQVHRGVLDGEPVAVKVIRPSIAARVRQDLALLDALSRPLAAALPGLDAARMIAEVRERVLDELDLDSEAEVQRRFHRALRDHPTLHVAAPVSRLAHHTVLVTPWLTGTPLESLAGRARDRAAALYVAFVLGGAHHGLAPAAADRHDALLLADGRLALLDFGAVGTTESDRIAASADALAALRGDDPDRYGSALQRLGVLAATEGEAALAIARRGLGGFADAGSSALDDDAVVAARDRLAEHPAELVRLATTMTLAPGDLWPLRGVSGVFAAVALSGGAAADWLRLAGSALREGWDAARHIERFL